MPATIGPVAAALMLTVTVKPPLAPAATGLVKVQTIVVPALPTAGVTHVAPAGGVNDWNVVFGGVVKSITGSRRRTPP